MNGLVLGPGCGRRDDVVLGPGRGRRDDGNWVPAGDARIKGLGEVGVEVTPGGVGLFD